MSGHGTPRVPPAVAVAYPPGTSPMPANFAKAGTYLASTALPAAGADTAPQALGVPLGTKRLTFWVTYTRGGAGGYPTFKPQFLGNGVGIQMSGNTLLDLSSFAAAAPLGAVNFYVEKLLGPAPSDGNALSYQLTFEVPAACIGAELLAAEAGNVGSPGTIEILYTLTG